MHTHTHTISTRIYSEVTTTMSEIQEEPTCYLTKHVNLPNGQEYQQENHSALFRIFTVGQEILKNFSGALHFL